MRRGTTPTHIFETDIDLTAAEEIYLTYRQDTCNILELTMDRMEVTPEQIQVSLTQAETLMFKANKPVYIQMRVKFADESAIASDVINTTTQQILKEGLI